MSAPTRRRYVLGLVYAEGDRVTTEAGTWTVHPNLCGTHPSSSMFVVGCRKMTGPRDARGFNGFGGTIRENILYDLIYKATLFEKAIRCEQDPQFGLRQFARVLRKAGEISINMGYPEANVWLDRAYQIVKPGGEAPSADQAAKILALMKSN